MVEPSGQVMKWEWRSIGSDAITPKIGGGLEAQLPVALTSAGQLEDDVPHRGQHGHWDEYEQAIHEVMNLNYGSLFTPATAIAP
jgi:hypothetical protein